MAKNISIPKKEGKGSFDWIPFLNYLSLGILIIGLLIWILWITWSEFNILSISIDNNTAFLLSALAQSLAAVLALVFTATLIVAQLSSRYSHRVLAYFFDAYTISYMLLFIIAVVLPIFLLANMHLGAIKASLILGAVCLVLLLPYFYRFRIMLTPEYLLKSTTNRALNRLRANTVVESRDLAPLDNIIMSSYNMRDYETFEKGVRCLVALFYEICKVEWMSPKTGKEITDDEIAKAGPFDPKYKKMFLGTGISLGFTRHSLEERIYNIAQAVSKDPIAPEQIIKALEIQAKDAIKDSRTHATLMIMLLIQRIAAPSTRNGSELHGDAANWSLMTIGLEALKSGQIETVNHALFELSWIGVQAYNAGLSEIVKRLVYSIERIGVDAGSKKISACATEAASRLFNLFGMTGLGETIPLYDKNHQPYSLKDDIIKSLRSIKSANKTEVVNVAFQKATDLQNWVTGLGFRAGVGAEYVKLVEKIYQELSGQK